MKVLNLYSGIGGNRKLWTDHFPDLEITAVELNEEIAAIYSEYFPQDKMVIGDAHEYLLKNYKEFDFIWSSPPCQTHSRARFWGSKGGLCDVKYPDMKLWQEIIFMRNFIECKTIIENVIPYYDCFLTPDLEIDKHLVWGNFKINKIDLPYPSKREDKIDHLKKEHGFDLTGKTGINKTQILRNLVNPDLGLYILEQARGIMRKENTQQIKMFE